MPTEPYKPILDPDFSIVGAKDVIEMTEPLLREVVNHATHAFQRCQSFTDALGEIDEDIAPFALYRLVTEATDAIAVLVRNSCGLGCVPLVRTSFEGSLALEYLLKADTPRRSLCWFTVYVINRLRSYSFLNPKHPNGQRFSEAWQSQFHRTFPVHPNTLAAVANLESLLQKAHLAPICSEYERLRKEHDGRRPEWYSLFAGPSNLRELASHLNREVEYDFLYRWWSSVAHAHDVSSFLTSKKDGSPAYKSMRYPGDIPQIAQFTSQFQVRATTLMIGRYRSGENLSRWYNAEVLPKLEALGRTQFTMHEIEE